MSAVNITSVNVLDNPAPFLNPLQFEIHYECLVDLAEGVSPPDCCINIIHLGTHQSSADANREAATHVQICNGS